jgi:ArsR family metal-binding transcriptional regulator
MRVATTFPNREAFGAAVKALDGAGLPYEVISPDPGYDKVGAPALVMDQSVRSALAVRMGSDLYCAGWVDHHGATIEVPTHASREFAEDVFGRAAVIVLASCMADETKIRIVAHISGDLTEVFPYLNAEMRHASYNAAGPTLTYMDAYRMVSVYARRIAVAKADEIVDAWRVLEELRCRANDAWARRRQIVPSYERRQKPPALEIYGRLPGINCGECGESTCLAFAVKVHGGRGSVRDCRPVFDGEFQHLKEALVEVSTALGMAP